MLIMYSAVYDWKNHPLFNQTTTALADIVVIVKPEITIKLGINDSYATHLEWY
jgi:hypothetical protein